MFLDLYLLDRLFHHLCEPSRWKRVEVKELAVKILKHDTIEINQWSIYKGKMNFLVLHVENPDELSKVVRWERVPVSEDVLHNIQHWQAKVVAAKKTIEAFTLTNVEEDKDKNGLFLTFHHSTSCYRISCDNTASIKTIGIRQWTRFLEEQQEKEKKLAEETKQREELTTEAIDLLRAENDRLKAQLQEYQVKNAELETSKAELMTLVHKSRVKAAKYHARYVRVHTSLLLLTAIVTLHSFDRTALDNLFGKGLWERVVVLDWSNKEEFDAFFNLKIKELVSKDEDCTQIRDLQQALNTTYEHYLNLQTQTVTTSYRNRSSWYRVTRRSWRSSTLLLFSGRVFDGHHSPRWMRAWI